MKTKSKDKNICVDCQDSFQCDICEKSDRHCKHDKPYFMNGEKQYPVHRHKKVCNKFSKRC